VDDFDGLEEESESRDPLEPKQDVRAAHCRKMAATVIKRAGITQPPVPVEILVQKAGLTMVVSALPRGVDAVLRPAEGIIEVATNQADVRKRFSIAHELGHHYLGHAHYESLVAEAQANIFAGALLMPSLWLRRDLKDSRSPDALAARYEVSREAIFIALKEAPLLNKVR
jgi:Zn-dependent peptidase ImmA (M78 family)